MSLANLQLQFHVCIIRSKANDIWSSSTACVLFPAAWLPAVVCCCYQYKAGITMTINRPSSDPGQQNEQFLLQLFSWVVVPSCTFQRASEKPHLKWIEKPSTVTITDQQFPKHWIMPVLCWSLKELYLYKSCSPYLFILVCIMFLFLNIKC